MATSDAKEITRHFADEEFCEAIQKIIDQKVGKYVGRLKRPQDDKDLRLANGAVVALTELKSEFEAIRKRAIEERS